MSRSLRITFIAVIVVMAAAFVSLHRQNSELQQRAQTAARGQ